MAGEPWEVESAELRGQVLALLRDVLGTATEVAAGRVLARRRDYWVLRLTLRRPGVTVVAKLAGPQAPYPCPFERTAALHGLVACRTTIPMPEVLAANENDARWPWRYLVKAYLPGREWATVGPRLEGGERAEAFAAMGRAVGELHAIAFPAFGELAPDLHVPAGAPLLPALRERAERIIPGPATRAWFLDLLQRNAALFAGAPGAGLCHEDLHKHNLLLRRQRGRWRLATILDFDKAWAGPGESDLARLELWRGMMDPAFWPAYTAVCPLHPGYAARRGLYQLLWCLEVSWDTPEHWADTRRVCAELGVEPPATFG